MDCENQDERPEGSNPEEDEIQNRRQDSGLVTPPQSVFPSPARVAIESLPPEKRKETILKWAGLGVSLLTLFAVIWYACTTRRMWIEMQEQTRIQRKTGINTERAWLGLDADLPIAISVLKTGPPRFEVRASYRIRNFGHGPAFKIASTGWITTDSDEMEQWAKSSCQETMNYTMGTLRVGSKIPEPPPMGRLAFPGQIIERPLDQSAPSIPNIKFIWFVGCISYKDQFDQPHWTRFCMLTPEWIRVTVFDEHTPLHMFGMYNDTDDDAERK